ncbi:MAG TPA: hypothetical protein DIC36_06430 [Gammaproteobacteria bacterium]|nr:hypothetical protein [Gammaproteobacteria bacterium]
MISIETDFVNTIGIFLRMTGLRQATFAHWIDRRYTHVTQHNQARHWQPVPVAGFPRHTMAGSLVVLSRQNNHRRDRRQGQRQHNPDAMVIMPVIPVVVMVVTPVVAVTIVMATMVSVIVATIGMTGFVAAAMVVPVRGLGDWRKW